MVITKRSFLLNVMAFIVCLCCFLSSPALANKRYASIVIDADSGQIIHQRHADKKLHPASLTKVMTLIMVFDALNNGKLGLNSRIRISSNAAAAVPSKLDLPIGSSIRVKDAIYALVTKSANDVAVAIAEKLSGSERRFAKKMTAKARKIGMHRTTFVNASGLHNSRQISTARDMAIMGRYLIQNYPREYKYFSRQYFTYQGKTYRNHNRLMANYKGMDGIKTGYINASGFNLLASAERYNKRLIGVVFGGRTTHSRNAHMKDLLDRSFEKSRTMQVAAKKFPIPDRKPVMIAALGTLNNLLPASGIPKRTASNWANLNTALQGTMFNSITEQGDSDPDLSQRIQAGLQAISAQGRKLSSPHSLKPKLTQPLKSRSASINEYWSIQIGAYTSRVQSEKILQNARAKLPTSLANASTLIVPLQRGNNWLFRARLNGYNKEQAHAACLYIDDCIVVKPQN